MEVFRGRARFRDRTGRRDVIGGDRIAEQRQHPGVDDIGDRPRLRREIGEETRFADIGGTGLEFEEIAGRNRQRLPALVAEEDIAVFLDEHFRRNAGGDRRFHIIRRRPDVGQEDRIAVRIVAERIGFEIDIDRARERVRDDQRWRRQERRPHLRMHATFEVAVARND